MSEILQEIEKELKRERWLQLWQTNRTSILYGVVGLVAALAVFGSLWAYNKSQVEEASIAFDRALSLGDARALPAFDALSEDGGIYGALASFHQAALLLKKRDWKKALAVYDDLADNQYLTASLRDLARVYGAQAGIGKLPYEAIEKRLTPAIAGQGLLRYAALEILGLAALEASKPLQAQSWLLPLVEDKNVPPTLAARAQILLQGIKTTPAAEEKKKK